jgi:hypothetical protein
MFCPSQSWRRPGHLCQPECAAELPSVWQSSWCIWPFLGLVTCNVIMEDLQNSKVLLDLVICTHRHNPDLVPYQSQHASYLTK